MIVVAGLVVKTGLLILDFKVMVVMGIPFLKRIPHCQYCELDIKYESGLVSKSLLIKPPPTALG